MNGENWTTGSRRKTSPVAQFVEHLVIMREITGLNPGRISIQDLKLTEEKVLPL